MLSAEDFDTVRSIARAGSDYGEIKRLLATTNWEMDADDTDLGFLRFFIPDETDKFYRLIISYRDLDHPPYSLITFHISPDSEEHLPAFNAAFHATAEAISQFLDAPTISGERRPSYRSWSYAWCRWSFRENEFTLVQGEFDIQDGMDVTLWIQPPGTPIDQIG